MKVKVLKAYTARKSNELNLSVDDILEVEEKCNYANTEQWKGILLSTGATGLFPSNCVTPIDSENNSGSLEKDKKMPFKSMKLVKKDSSSASTNTSDSAPRLPPKPVREQVKAIFPYKAQNEDELTIKEGDIITVISKENEDVGWWKGELNGRIALFPDNFVEVIQPSPAAPTSNEKLRIKKPERVNSTSSTNSTSGTTDNSGNSTNSYSSVPIINKMLKFAHNNTASNAASLPSAGHRTQQDNISTTSTSSTNSQSGLTTNGRSKTPDSDISPGDEDKSNKEDSFNTDLSPSKLVHLTTQRPKIPPTSRRPPSLHLGKCHEMIDAMDMEECPSPKKSPVGIQLKPVIKPEPTENSSSSTTEKKAPWLSELKKSQERRQMADRKTNGPSATTLPSSATPVKPHAPTPPNSKPTVASGKSTYQTATQNNASVESSNNNESQSVVATLQPASSEANKSTTTSASGINANSSLVVVSGTAASAGGSSNNNNTTTTAATILPMDGQLLAAKEEEISKMKLEINTLNDTVVDLKDKISEMNKEIAQLNANLKSQNELAQQKTDIAKQIQEQNNSFESHKKQLSDMVKELINELAEEKKKTAYLMIEIERIRRLHTTV